MVGVLSSRDRQIFRTAMLAITRQDIYELENAIMSLGVLKTKINHNELYEVSAFLWIATAAAICRICIWVRCWAR